MLRSEINRILRETIEFVNSQNFGLPPFAFWTPNDWVSKGHEVDEIRDCMLGWDVTDFGLNYFYLTGLVLFAIRNGNYTNVRYTKSYAEKLLIVKEEQITPMHFHMLKMEDIINRGGGNLMIQVYNATPDDKLANTPVTVSMDGVEQTVDAGTTLRLRFGESIALPPRLYHTFRGQGGYGTVLVGEVSKVNDDNTDNKFLDLVGRFPAIKEDESPLHYLCWEYPPAKD